MATVGPKAITTLSDVKAALLRSDAADELAEEVFTDGGNYDEEGVAGIQSASDDIRNYLHRDLFAQKWTPLLAGKDWKKVKRTPDSSYGYELRLHRIPDWPVLKVSEDVKIHNQRRIFAPNGGQSSITLWAGYRREGQSASDLGVSGALSTSEIPVYPGNAVQVCKRIAVFYAVQKVKGLIGVQSETQMMGEWSSEARTTETDRNFVHNQLKTLHCHRSLG